MLVHRTLPRLLAAALVFIPPTYGQTNAEKIARLEREIAIMMHASVNGNASAVASEERVGAEANEDAQTTDGNENMLATLPATAETDAEKIERLEREIEALRKAYIEGAPRRIKRIADAGKEPSWSDRIELGALIEVEAAYVKSYEGGAESDLVVATFAPYITSKLTAWIGLEGALLYEQGDTDLEVDIATVSIANPEKTAVYSIIGQTYMPFGNYDTNLASDPLTLEIGESREVALQLGAATARLTGTIYLFNGNAEDDEGSQLNDYGAFLGYGTETDNSTFTFGLGYMKNLGDSDGLQDGITVADEVSGTAVNASVDFAGFGLIGEWVGANDRFEPDNLDWQGRGARPSAWNLEAGYTFEAGGRENTMSVAYQGTRESVALELPETRALIGYSTELLENISLLLECAYDTDYGITDGGTGNVTSAFTAQLVAVF